MHGTMHGTKYVVWVISVISLVKRFLGVFLPASCSSARSEDESIGSVVRWLAVDCDGIWYIPKSRFRKL